MTGRCRVGVRIALFVILLAGLVTGPVAFPASADNCPRPGALGTSRTLVVDAKEHPLIGSMQYRETLPLNEGEVVLTFDDGPLPKYSNQILDILAAHCVKATFFLVGRQAQANPEGVRRVLDAGHTVATHSQNHPVGMQHLPADRTRAEIDEGIASVTAALGERSAALAPFFRIPGLSRNDEIEDYARSKGLQVWSADFPADDWRNVSSTTVYHLAMKRLAAKGKGVLLLHDIQPRTVAALPRILHDLKARGYRIVHVVPATPETPATPTDPQQWRPYGASEPVATLRWPQVPGFAFAPHEPLPAPLLTDSYWNDIDLLDRPLVRGHGVPLPGQAPWPRQVRLASNDVAGALPFPAASLFEVAGGVRLAMLGLHTTPRPAERHVAVQTNDKPALVAVHHDKHTPVAAGRGKPLAAAPAARHARPAGQPGRTAPRPVITEKQNLRRAIRNNQQVRL